MGRCPGSHQTPDISRAIRAWGQLNRYSTWPVDGGTQDQAASFLDFLVVIEAAVEDAKPK